MCGVREEGIETRKTGEPRRGKAGGRERKKRERKRDLEREGRERGGERPGAKYLTEDLDNLLVLDVVDALWMQWQQHVHHLYHQSLSLTSMFLSNLYISL